MNQLDYKKVRLYPDKLIWSAANPRLYAQMFEHYIRSPVTDRDAIAWTDYLIGNKN